MARQLFPLALLILCSGCFQAGLFLQDHVFSSPGMDKATSSVPYRYLGCHGPHRIALANERGVKASLDFEAFFFPSFDDWENYNLESVEGEALQRRAEKTIRDYFGLQREVHLIVFKKIGPDDRAHRYLIDAKLPDALETIGERLVEAGLARVHHSLASAADAKTLIKLEDMARRSRRGIWQYAPIHNPNWHD